MSFRVAFSGGCHSGKTTLINKLKSIAPDDVVTCDECVRSRNIKSIDDIRKDPAKYLDFEIDVISKKILDEEYSQKIDDKIILFDRSLADSLFYFTHYLRRESLDAGNQLVYDASLESLLRICKKHFDDVYDKVFLLKPIQITQDAGIFRPSDIVNSQNIEHETISKLANSFEAFKTKWKISEVDATDEYIIPKFIEKCQSLIDLASPLTVYSDYNGLVEDMYFLLNNVMMNTYGSFELCGQSRANMLFSAALFSSDKKASDSILSKIKEIRVEDEYMDSRCYPTGVFDKGNVMIVGEAPGQKGRAIKSTYLKPSFIYTKTSWTLRRAIDETFIAIPYITNLLKYARKNNSVSFSDFDNSAEILQMEIDLMEPRNILALGNNVYNYMSKKFPNLKCTKIMHPAAISYTGNDINAYIKHFKENAQ